MNSTCRPSQELFGFQLENWSDPMKRTLVAVVLVVTTQMANAAEPVREFLSWYNGWGEHTVWGIGKVSGSYIGTTVKCGTVLIPVRAIYDTHADRDPPSSVQTESYAATSNRALLDRIAGKCEFLLRQ